MVLCAALRRRGFLGEAGSRVGSELTWAPSDTPPWKTLLWANDRTDLPGQDRQVGWKWHCAPLSEWDGTNPIRVSGPAGV